MSSVKGDGPDHLLALLGHLLDAIGRDVRARTQGIAGTGLRTSQLRLLSLTPADGLRVTDLAERVGMTKQALGEFATVLEDRGLLESLRDPADRRVRILRPTAAGRAAVAEGTAVIEEVEAEWRARLGAGKWDQLQALLREAVAVRG
ncbi:MarR family winged helix-turn-helix transcriptional regulator [uncultured Nocardioides sp.]|uniref:MarR family winged helix-turn-helix transcriptional regulator n=1 Tax=uncultured Nocardioides sp. TaxID=198441 RepID=UPI0025E385DE|nr:MarR family winged helix-turn-helix transcriptional regulator [uncultured Nocardioides sp.]